MSYESNANLYHGLIRSFLVGDVSAADFASHFMEVWKRDRDEENSVRLTWDRPYDQELIERRQSGALTDREFSEQWFRLWGISEPGSVLRNVLDRVFTACDVFNEDQERASYELDETGLQREAQELIVELEAASKTLIPREDKPSS